MARACWRPWYEGTYDHDDAAELVATYVRQHEENVYRSQKGFSGWREVEKVPRSHLGEWTWTAQVTRACRQNAVLRSSKRWSVQNPSLSRSRVFTGHYIQTWICGFRARAFSSALSTLGNMSTKVLDNALPPPDAIYKNRA